jgi:hypothetical protein
MSDQYSLYLTVLLILVGLAVAWVLLRFILRLTTKFLTCGCVLIFVLGLILLFATYLKRF